MTDTKTLENLGFKMDLMAEQLREVRDDVRTMNDKLIRLEAQNPGHELQLLEARMVMLEADFNRRAGAFRLGETLPKIAGWIFGAFAVLYAYFSKQG